MCSLRNYFDAEEEDIIIEKDGTLNFQKDGYAYKDVKNGDVQSNLRKELGQINPQCSIRVSWSDMDNISTD